MTTNERRLRVLACLEHGDAYGLDLVAAKAVPRRTCYVHLASMENDGLIRSFITGEDLDVRRRYSITDVGRQMLVASRLPTARVT